MAQLLPADISDKEIVGRRAFGSDKSVFSRPGKPEKYRIDVFMDDRLETDLSVDRLGVRKPDPDRMVELDALGTALGAKQEKQFRGWAQLPVKDLGLTVRRTDAEGEANPYHAEISRDEHRTDQTARSLAFRLCLVASEFEFIVSPVVRPAAGV
jgi:hypothetical protein